MKPRLATPTAFLAMLGSVICVGCGTSLPAIEGRARAAEAAGKPAEAMAHYVNALKALRPQDAELDFQIRKRAIALAQRTRPPLTVPAEARQAFYLGEALTKKAVDEVDWSKAAREFEKALTLAPWLTEAYYKLGQVQASRERYDEGISNLKLYLVAVPNAPNKAEVERKMAELEVEKRKHGIWALEGTWAEPKAPHTSYYEIEVRHEELYVSLVFLEDQVFSGGRVLVAGKRWPQWRWKLDGRTLTGAQLSDVSIWKVNRRRPVKGIVSKTMDEIRFQRHLGPSIGWIPTETWRRWTPPR